MSAGWKRVREFIIRRLLFGITRSGALFALAATVVGVGAALSANNLLFLILAAMLSAFMVSGFVSRMCLAGLELDFLAPEHIPAGRDVPGKLFVRNIKWFMPSFSVRVEAIHGMGSPTLMAGVYFPLVAGRATVEGPVVVRFPKRGAYRENNFSFFTSFPFGFLEKSARVTLRREMIVYPCLDPHPGFEEALTGISGEIETHYRGLGRDFYRIRPYEVLESARHVDWKATAHVGALQVREFAREREQTVEIFLDRDIPAALDAWFEHAVDCCAFLAWRLSNQEVSVHFRSQSFAFRQPEDGDIYAVLRYLALVYPQRAEETESPLEEDSYKIVFSPSPRRFEAAGWRAARFFDPVSLPLPSRSVQ
jgi:uncharacterized protein (DUF58 family)